VAAADPVDGRQVYGQDPASYRAGRPDYPQRVFDVLVDRCGLGEASRVLEIGPGTGLATARLLALGANVTAVEVNPSMATYLRETLPDDALQVVRSSFEDAPLMEASFDLAVAANAFHWVDQEVGPKRLRHLVVAGGWIAIWGMLFDDPTRPDDLAPSMQSLLGVSSIAAAEPGELPFHLDMSSRLPGLHNAGFVEVDNEVIRSDVTMTAAQVRALYASMTLILCRPRDEQAGLLDTIEGIVRDDFGGHVDRHFITILYTARNP
jgi:SAM-dependent methyltransferase